MNLVNCDKCGTPRLTYSKCKPCKTEYNKTYYQNKAEELKEKANQRHKKLRLRVLETYGNKCVCCGETTNEFLAIDHVKGNGNAHRREMKENGGGHYIMHWIIKHNFPKDFQILCHNCNMSKGFYGYCPHSAKVSP
jgi:hypothetical protein